MRGRPKKPIDLLLAEGKSNLTKAEIEKRKAEELVVPFTDISVPDYLEDEKLINEFYDIADKLLALNIMTELDEDTLARYVMAKAQWLNLTRAYNNAVKSKDYDLVHFLDTKQDRAFKQCRSAASDLGLTITSRARLVVPQVEQPKQNKFIAKFSDKN
ncbi:phage terminase small subunit P27 family [Thiopseudomonas sp. 4R-3cl]|nr:phage terminase small subunit P27 family [Thiopseudomonas sp. 4R-3cl]